MKKKKINWWLVTKLAIAILAIVLVVLVVLKVIKGKEVDTNTSMINEIYTYLGQNDLSYCSGLNTYSNETVSYDSLSNADKICNAVASLYLKDEATLMKIDKSKKNNTCSIANDLVFATDNYESDMCSLYRIDKDKVSEKYKSMYGKELENDESFTLSNTMICYPHEDSYYCGLSETFTVTVGVEPATYRSIKEAVEKNNKLIIYDYFIKIANDECFTTYTTDTINSKCSADYKEKQKVNYSYLKKYGTLYKHTFEKDSKGNYYWVQSEPN